MSDTAPVQTPVPTDTPPVAPTPAEPVVQPAAPAPANTDMDVSNSYKPSIPTNDPTAVNKEGKAIYQSTEQKQAAFYTAIQGKSPEDVVKIATEWGLLPAEPVRDPKDAEVQVLPKEDKKDVVTQLEFDMAKAGQVLQDIKDKKQQGDPATPEVQWQKDPQTEDQSETIKRISELEQAIETEKAQRKADEFAAKEKVHELEYQVKAKDDTLLTLRNELNKYTSNLNLYEVNDPQQKNFMESSKAYMAEKSEDNLYTLLWAMAQYWNLLTKQDISANIVNLKQVVSSARSATATNPNLVNYAQSLKAINDSQNAGTQKQKEEEARRAKALNVG